MRFINVFCIAAVSTIAALGYSSSAQAISFKITSGVPGLNGQTNQGAFSEFSKLKETTTIDFNSGSVPTTGFAKYSFENNTGASSVRSDQWAPAGSTGEKNGSKYLAVFNGDAATIKLDKTLNYFGIDWGAVSENNTFSFYQSVKDGKDALVKSFTSADLLNNKALFNASWQGGQGNGYVHFYSDSIADNFNKIVISQSSTVGGGFESDNHSFHQGTGKFDFDGNLKAKSVPEPGIVLGLLATGGMFLRKRSQKLSQE